MIYELIIAGGGAAGLFAAANIKGVKTLLLEKNDIYGRKLLAAGSGKCNITHEGKIQDFFDKYGKNGKFLKKALMQFDNSDVIEFFEKNGVDCFTDKNGKIFPKSERARDILELLLKEGEKNGVEFVNKSPLTEISYEDGIFIVKTRDKSYKAERVLLATGGKSYPTLGTSGDGYSFAEKLGHTIVNPKPALTPVFIKEFNFGSCAGVSFKDREVTILRGAGRKKEASRRGDIGITHQGISGPGIIDFSREFEEQDILSINFIDKSCEKVETDFMEYIAKHGKNSIKTFYRESGMADSFIRAAAEKIGIDENKRCSEVSKAERKNIVNSLCAMEFEIDKIGGYETAMVTAGGVDCSEVSAATMESKLVKNLYFAGELLDIDGDTGGYNIQAAFSTAFASVKKIMADISEKREKTI